MTMKKLLPAAVLALMGSVLSPVASSAVITWSTPFDTSGTGDVFNGGHAVEAFNIGASASNVTVNGVDFASTDAILDRSAGVSFLDGATSGDAAYDDLLDSLDFGNGISYSFDIGGGSLTAGTKYLVQAWFTDLRSCCSGRTMVLGDGGANTVGINAMGGGLGQFAIGTFIADAATQTLSLASPGFRNVHLSAYQVREVPAPATLLLMGIGLAGLCYRRKV